MELHKTTQDIELHESNVHVELSNARAAQATLESLQWHADQVPVLERQIRVQKAQENAQLKQSQSVDQATHLLDRAKEDLSRFKGDLPTLVNEVERLTKLLRSAQEQIRKAEQVISSAADGQGWVEVIERYQTADANERKRLLVRAGESSVRSYGDLWRACGGLDKLLSSSPENPNATYEEIQTFDLLVKLAGIVVLFHPSRSQKPDSRR